MRGLFFVLKKMVWIKKFGGVLSVLIVRIRVEGGAILMNLKLYGTSTITTNSQILRTSEIVLINNLKEKSKVTTDSGSFLIVKCVTQCTADVSDLPKLNNLRKIVNRSRKADGNHRNPLNLEELCIDGDYKVTLSNKPFLLFDSGPHNDRFLLFSTGKNLNILSRCEHWFAEGTFKCSPPLFSQLFVIHGLWKTRVMPLVYILMSNRKETSYLLVFQKLASMLNNPVLKTTMTDFEYASLNAFQKVFPQSQQRECFFHFMQSVWKKIQTLGEISARYKDDAYFKFHVKYLCSLPFVPLPDVTDAYTAIIESPFFAEHARILEPLLNYFEDTWVGSVNRGGRRRRPLYPAKMWNVFDAVAQGWPKTNNNCESFHRAFHALLSTHHPVIWKFIDGLKKQEKLVAMTIAEIQSGCHPGTNQRKRSRLNSDRLLTVVSGYGNEPIIDYVKGIVSNIDFV